MPRLASRRQSNIVLCSKNLYQRLADFPDSGAARPKVGRTVRFGVAPPYIVLYRHVEADDLVIVLRILHSRRKITGKMLRTGGRSS
jgi:toxin ParE1/3/4